MYNNKNNINTYNFLHINTYKHNLPEKHKTFLS